MRLSKQVIAGVAVVGLFIAAGGVVTPVSANGVDQILENMKKAAKNVTSMQARLSQERKLDIGGRERFEGLLKVQRGAKQGAEKAYVKYDNGQELSVVGDKIVLYQPSINQVILTSRQRIGNKNADYAWVTQPFASVDELKARYHIRHRGDEGNLAVLELEPKNPNLQKSTIWVNRTNWLPERFRVAEKGGGYAHFTLSQIAPNYPFKDADFVVKYPKDAQVIKQ